MKRTIRFASGILVAAAISNCDITLLGTGGGELDASLDTQPPLDVRIPDAQYIDQSAPDSPVADTAQPDSAEPDTSVPDAGMDAADSGVDSAPDSAPDAARDAADASLTDQCIVPTSLDLSGANGAVLNGDAAPDGTDILLTANAANKAGSARWKIGRDISKGFVVAINYVITSTVPAEPADGLTLGWMAPDNGANGVVGKGGADLGLCDGGIKNSESIALDTYLSNADRATTTLDFYTVAGNAACSKTKTLATGVAANNKVYDARAGAHTLEIRQRNAGPLVVLIDGMVQPNSAPAASFTLVNNRDLVITASTGGKFSEHRIKKVAVGICP
jgi:hypothetical protein